MQRTKSPTNQSDVPKQDIQMMNLAMEAFKSKGYLIVNKTLIKRIGLMKAILLSVYIDKHSYFQTHYPENAGWFYLTHSDITEQLNISEYTIRNVKNELMSMGLIYSEMRGLPIKEWLFIDYMTLLNLVNPTLQNTSGITLSNSSGLTLINSSGLYKETRYINTKKEKNNTKKDKKTNILTSQEILNMFPISWKENKEFSSSLSSFIQYRKNKGNPIRLTSVQAIINKLEKAGIVSSIEALQVSVENEWTGIFPKQNSSQQQGFDFPTEKGISPHQQIKNHFSSKPHIPELFIQWCYEPALAMINENDSPDALVVKLLQFYDYINQEQDRHFTPRLRETLSGPMDVIEEYIMWIKENNWIMDRGPKLFQSSNVLFGKYRRASAMRDNMQRDPLTGESSLGE